MTQRRQPKARSEEFQRLVNQEDLLAEISERLFLEMSSSGVSESSLAKLLGKDASYVDGLINGFANITVRELADVFSAFKKIVSLNLLSGTRARSQSIITNVVNRVVFCDDVPEIDRVTLIFENKTHKYEARVDFLSIDVLEGERDVLDFQPNWACAALSSNRCDSLLSWDSALLQPETVLVTKGNV